MATEFQMPKLGLTMESGTILAWLVDDGVPVAEGDPVMLIETDKVESEVGSSAAGILRQAGAVGDTFACGERVGWLLAPGEEAPVSEPTVHAAAAPVAAPPTAAPAPVAPAARPAVRGEGGRLLASPNARRVAVVLGIDVATVRGTGPGGRVVSEDVEAAAASGPHASVPAAVTPVARPPGEGRALASFAARTLADQLGVDLDAVGSLTGDARLTRDDVLAHARALIAIAQRAPLPPPLTPPPVASPAASPAATAPLLQEPTVLQPLRGMRKTIASRMHESLQQMAQLTLFVDADMSAVVADRARRAELGSAPGYTDYVIAATARALVEHPVVNSQLTADGVAHLPGVHVGLAVALDSGLVVPVVRDSPGRTLDALSAETSRLAVAARDGALQLADLEGATFAVTALGMFGVDGFTPIVNAPNTAILGVGRLRDEVAWDGDMPRRTTVLTLSLTWDHRAFDGAPAAQFASTVKRHLETDTWEDL